MGQRRTLQFGEAFAKWGGFAPVKVDSQAGASSRMNEAQARWELAMKDSKRPGVTKSGSEATKDAETHPEEAVVEEVDEVQEEQTSVTAKSITPDVTSSPTLSPTTPPSPVVEVKISGKFREKRSTSQLTKRQRLLVQARELAKQPLPEEYTQTPEVKAEKAAKNEEEKKALQETNASLMAKVWKLFGGGHS